MLRYIDNFHSVSISVRISTGSATRNLGSWFKASQTILAVSSTISRGDVGTLRRKERTVCVCNVMGRCSGVHILFATLWLLHFQHEGEGAQREVLEVEVQWSENTDLYPDWLGHYCNATITYLSGEGKLPSRRPHVDVTFLEGVKFTYNISCGKKASLHCRNMENGTTWERIEDNSLERSISYEGFLHHHYLFECLSAHGSINAESEKTDHLNLRCTTTRKNFFLSGVKWSIMLNDSTFMNIADYCKNSSLCHLHTPFVKKDSSSDKTKARLKSHLRVDLSHLQSEVLDCSRTMMGGNFKKRNNYFIVRRLENVNYTQSTIVVPTPTTAKIATTANKKEIADTSSVENSNTLMVALSATAAGVTGLVVIVLFIMWYWHRHAGDQSMPNIRVATTLLRLPRRLRSHSNDYVGHGDRLLSDVENIPSPRAVQRYGTSSLHYSKQWEISRDRITQLAPTGQGCYGKVMECNLAAVRDSTTSCKVAVKTAKRSSDKTALREIVTEALVMRRVGSDEHVLKLLGACTRRGPLSLVMEHACLGNLRQYLRSRRPCDNDPLGVVSLPAGSNAIIMTEEILLRYALQIAKGMKYLISKETLHCNLCARSILVFENDTLKLSNFGVVKEKDYHDYYSGSTPDLSPVKWQAPETFQNQNYSEYSDVWAFGILMWEIATLGGTPYPGVAIESLRDLIVQSGYRMQRPRNCSRRVYSLMTSCWMMSPRQRHRFFVLIVKILSLLSEIENERGPTTPADELEVVVVDGESSGHAG